MSKEAYIVAGAGNGDEGKGTNVDFLCNDKRAHTVVRYGGPQAGHGATSLDGRQHVFAQFGAGSFVPGCETHLSRFMVVKPFAMLFEAEHLAHLGVMEILRRTTISENALVATDLHTAANRLRELARGDARHGSCGMGIGEAVADTIAEPTLAVRAGDYRDPEQLRAKLRRVQEHKRAQLCDVMGVCRSIPAARPEIKLLEDTQFAERELDFTERFRAEARIVPDAFLGEVLRRPGTVVFEGSQGMLLDEWRGFHPYTTWSTCGFANALTLLQEHGYDGEVTRVAVTRAYATRHGPGPFVTDGCGFLRSKLPDSHNTMNDWQRQFRVGWFDAVALRYALAACGGADFLAVTCVDRLTAVPRWHVCDRYVLRPEVGDEQYFVRDASGSVQDIRLGPERDLFHQEELTRRLFQATPSMQMIEYTGTESEAEFFDRYLRMIAEQLRTPIRLVSEGKTARDKRWVNITA